MRRATSPDLRLLLKSEANFVLSKHQAVHEHEVCYRCDTHAQHIRQRQRKGELRGNGIRALRSLRLSWGIVAN